MGKFHHIAVVFYIFNSALLFGKHVFNPKVSSAYFSVWKENSPTKLMVTELYYVLC